MKSINTDPGKKQELTEKNISSSQSNIKKKGVYSDIGSKKSRNYMEGDDDVNGPDWDRSSENSDGDTSQNAGIFK